MKGSAMKGGSMKGGFYKGGAVKGCHERSPLLVNKSAVRILLECFLFEMFYFGIGNLPGSAEVSLVSSLIVFIVGSSGA